MAADGGNGSLAERLLRPARRVTLTELQAQWFHSIVAVRCRGARSLAADPKLAGTLRGAWGEQLKATASAEAIAGEPCLWRPPCALDVLFRTQGRITPALEIPKPYALALLADGADLVVRLTVFGFATEWTEAAADALVRAVRGLGPGGQSLDVVDRCYWSEDAIAIEAAPAAVVLAFATPLEIRQRERARDLAGGGDGDAGSFDLPMLVASLGNRISGLARWQDVAIEADFRALKEQAAAVAVRLLEGAPDRWLRFSRRQGQWIPMAGRRLVALIEGELAPLLPLLAIGETCHAGSHASLGLGRYTLLVPR